MKRCKQCGERVSPFVDYCKTHRTPEDLATNWGPLEAGQLITLTKEDGIEVSHKMEILAVEPELQEDYSLTAEQARALSDSVPCDGLQWQVPQWALQAVRGEMENHCKVMRDGYADGALSAGERGQALRIFKQAKRFEQIFGLTESGVQS